jgi:hypothetical protein
MCPSRSRLALDTQQGHTSARFTYFATVPLAGIAIIGFLRFEQPQLNKPAERETLRSHVAPTLKTMITSRVVLLVLLLTAMAGLLSQAVFEFGPLWLVALAAPPVVLRNNSCVAEFDEAQLSVPPALDSLYDEGREELCRALVRSDVLAAAGEASSFRLEEAKSLWLAQLAAWLPSEDRPPLVNEALRVLGGLEERIRLDTTVAVLTILSGLVQSAALHETAEAVAQHLPDRGARVLLRARVQWLYGKERPPVSQLLEISDEASRLEALVGWAGEVSWSEAHRLIDQLVDSFTEPNFRAQALTAVIRGLRTWQQTDGLRQSDEQKALAIALEGRDPVVVNEAFTWLELASSDRRRVEIRAARLTWNMSIGDPSVRAASLISAISLGVSDDDNANLALEALSAISRVQDGNLQAHLLKQYVGSIPGSPPWGVQQALLIARTIVDERLQARALGSLLLLGAVRQQALRHGLTLRDPWARASVVFEWASWSPPPRGYSRRTWQKVRVDAARAVENPEPHARYLALAALGAKGSARRQLASEAYEATLALTRPSARAYGVYALVNESLVPRTAVDDALRAGWDIPIGYGRYAALAKISRLLAPRRFAEVVREMLQDITVNANQINFRKLTEPPGLDLGLVWLR